MILGIKSNCIQKITQFFNTKKLEKLKEKETI